MKQKLSLVFAVILISICGFSQDMESKYSGPKKGEVLAVHFNMSDYKAPIGIKSPVSGKVYSTIPEMSKGFSISYWRGLTNKIDLSLKATGTFLEYPTLSSTVVSRREFSPEAEAALNIRPYGNNSLVAPFLTVGIGAAYPVDTKKFGAYVPLGVGVQTNLSSTAYIFVQALYRASLTKSVIDDNMFYSLGLGQSIGKKKKSRQS